MKTILNLLIVMMFSSSAFAQDGQEHGIIDRLVINCVEIIDGDMKIFAITKVTLSEPRPVQLKMGQPREEELNEFLFVGDYVGQRIDEEWVAYRDWYVLKPNQYRLVEVSPENFTIYDRVNERLLSACSKERWNYPLPALTTSN